MNFDYIKSYEIYRSDNETYSSFICTSLKTKKQATFPPPETKDDLSIRLVR